MVLIGNNIFFLFYSLLFFDCKVFSHNHDNVYAPDQIADEVYRTPRNTLRRSEYKKEISDPDYQRGGNRIDQWINDIDVVDAKMQPLRIFYEPSVPRPRLHHWSSKELRQALYGRLFTRRMNMATQGGYTNNADTCDLYNKNLAQVWTTLSKFINHDQEMPDNMALHNIVLLVKAYLDHHSLIKNTENIQEKETANPSENITETLKEIKEMLKKETPKNDEETPVKIVDSIINHTKAPKEKEYEKCFESSKEKLKLNVIREYQRYKEFSDCRRVNKLEKLVSLQDADKMNFSDAKSFLRQWEDDPASNCSLVARNTFLETLKAIIDSYIVDVQCLP